MVKCDDGPMVATPSYMMEKQHRQSTLWILCCHLAVQVCVQLHCSAFTFAQRIFQLIIDWYCVWNCLLIDWQSEFGGYTCYVANEEDEEVNEIIFLTYLVHWCMHDIHFFVVNYFVFLSS